MTISLLLDRQHSYTVGNSTEDEKRTKPKLYRWSSLNEHKSNIETSNHNRSKKKLGDMNCQSSGDCDSGVEDLELQLEKVDGHLHSTKFDDEQDLPTFCGTEENEEIVEQNINNEDEHPEAPKSQLDWNDLVLAAKVPDNDKKDFCSSTIEVFHAEFARLIYYPIVMSHPHFKYHLFAKEELYCPPIDWPHTNFIKLDNAKVQFKCQNSSCQRSWTSMRARIVFYVSLPQSHGHIILEIVKQDCRHCNTEADALWYMDEICRVMRNLSQSIFERYSFLSVEQNVIQNTDVNGNNKNTSQRTRHDPKQRKGNMQAKHDSSNCHACRIGWCYY